MPFEVDWRPGAIADVQDLFDYLAEHASLGDARHVDLPLDDRARGGRRACPASTKFQSNQV